MDAIWRILAHLPRAMIQTYSNYENCYQCYLYLCYVCATNQMIIHCSALTDFNIEHAPSPICPLVPLACSL